MKKLLNVLGSFPFDKVCGTCRRFGFDSCPNKGKVLGGTIYENLKCKKYIED